jgi:hypothetical protein
MPMSQFTISYPPDYDGVLTVRVSSPSKGEIDPFCVLPTARKVTFTCHVNPDESDGDMLARIAADIVRQLKKG